jgi:hypothetical protein
MKTNTSLAENVELTDENKTFVHVHKHRTPTILSLTAGNISAPFCSRILSIPVPRESKIFHNLETFFYT